MTLSRIAALFVAGTASSVAAQAVPPAAIPPQLPSQSDISRARVDLPPPEPTNFDLRIQAPDRSAVPKAVDTVDLNLKQIDVQGVTALPKAEVDAFFSGLVGHTVYLQDVRDAAATLEAAYRKRGYFLSRVFIPPQRLSDGTLTVRVVEGYIDKIDVQGLDKATRRKVAAILDPLTGRKPIDLPSVERRLLILNDLPGLSATSVLRQGGVLGGSDMVVTLRQPRDGVFASVSNTNSRILGPWVYSLNGSINRPAGLPGSLSVGVAASGPGLGATQSISGRYSLALGHDGLVASIGAILAKAHPGASLEPLDVRSNLRSFSGRVRYPIIRSRAQSLFIEGGLTLNRSTTDILGQRLVEDRDTVIDAALLYQQAGWMNGSTNVTIDLYKGLPIFGALDRGAPSASVAAFNPTFARVTYSVQRLQVIAPRVTLLATVQGQYSETKLLSGELVAFGGPAIGRGYDPSTITGDRGFATVGEVRYDLLVGKPWLATVQFYGFADGARATTLATATTDKISANIRSAGIGVRLGQRYVSVDLSAAKAFRRIAGGDQRGDPRVLLTLTANY